MSVESINPKSISASGSITANSGQTVSLVTTGYGTVFVGVFGTYGSVGNTFEISMDGGTTWDTCQMVRFNTSTIESSTTSLTNTTRTWVSNISGATNFRVRNTAWTSGTQSVKIYALPYGSDRFANVQGTITANQGGTWNIGTVTTVTTVTSISNTVSVGGTVLVSNTILGTAGSCSIGKFEDSTASGGDTGAFVFAVRNDTADSATAGSDGDYIQFSTDNVGALRASLPHSSRSDTYTGTANGTTVSRISSYRSKFSIQVKGTAASATTWDVRLEGSLDNVNFQQIIQHTNTDGDGAVKWTASDFPSLYFRSRCAGLVLGGATNIIVTIVGAQ